MIKVLFCGLKYEYANPNRGLSFEYQNFYDSLTNMPGVQAEFFGFDEVVSELGLDKMNRELIARVETKKPDLLFCFLFTEEIKKETIKYITQKTSTKTFNWFADDHWRFHIFSKFWAPLFTAVGTTDSLAVAKYYKLGYKHVIHTQWGVNPRLFYPKVETEGVDRYKITFVGQNYSIRQKYINSLQKAGLPIVAYGTGWPAGTVAKEQSGIIWSNSKINLNFTEGNYDNWKVYAKLFGKLFFKKELGRYRLNIHQVHNNFRSIFSTRRKQIKSRNFEIPACGGFLLTGDADNLGDYYEKNKEIAVFEGVDDLIDKCRLYLKEPELRRRIAKAGYERTMRDHTYARRFSQIFETIL